MGKRVLWLLNNSWLRQFEVPCLIDLGYEVFCPKICGYGLGECVLSVTDEYDSSLSLPPDILNKLNHTDLYNDVDRHVFSLLNQYFDYVFLLPEATLIRDYIQHFGGVIILRWLGDEEGLTCTERLIRDGGYSLLYQINRCKERFYFAHMLKDDWKGECDIFRGRRAFLPVPVVTDEAPCERNIKKTVLLCSNICLDEGAYKAFAKYYKLFDGEVIVCGDQLVPSRNHQQVFAQNDWQVQLELLRHAEVAVAPDLNSTLLCEMWMMGLRFQVPLLYTGGAAAGLVLGNKGPGFCKTADEVRKKATRILKGDRRLALELQRFQLSRLKDYTFESCLKTWKEAIGRFEINVGLFGTGTGMKKKVCVVLPVPDTGKLMTFSVHFATALQREIQRRSVPVELLFAHVPLEEYRHRDSFAKIREAGIKTREIIIEEKDEAFARRMLELAGYWPTGKKGDIPVPVGALYYDHIHTLIDCDYLIFTTDASGASVPAMPIYPYAIVAHDYRQRYVDTEDGPVRVAMNRNADRVFVSSKAAFLDCIQYGMVKRTNITRIPMLFSLPERDIHSPSTGFDYILWPTSIEENQNHIQALVILQRYYETGGSLPCKLTGDQALLLFPGNGLPKSEKKEFRYLEKVHAFLNSHAELLQHLTYIPTRNDKQYKAALRNAGFIFHPGFADQGNMISLDAVAYGTPTLSNDYPGMRCLSEDTEMYCCFVRMADTQEAAEALHQMEKSCHAIAEKLDYDRINRHSVAGVQQAFYDSVADAIGFGTGVGL